MKNIREDINEKSTDQNKNLDINLEEHAIFTRTLLEKFHERLTEVGNENREITNKLREKLPQSRKNLSASEAKKLDDFEQAMGKVCNSITGIQDSIANLTNNLSGNRINAAYEWQSLADAITRMKDEFITAPMIGKPGSSSN